MQNWSWIPCRTAETQISPIKMRLIRIKTMAKKQPCEPTLKIAVSWMPVHLTTSSHNPPMHMHAQLGWVCMWSAWGEGRKLMPDTSAHYMQITMWFPPTDPREREKNLRQEPIWPKRETFLPHPKWQSDLISIQTEGLFPKISLFIPVWSPSLHIKPEVHPVPFTRWILTPVWSCLVKIISTTCCDTPVYWLCAVLQLSPIQFSGATIPDTTHG